MLLIKVLKRRGLRTDPWGTPVVRGRVSDVFEFILSSALGEKSMSFSFYRRSW